MRWSMPCRAARLCTAVLWAGVAGVAAVAVASPVAAQAPPPSPEANEIAACLCLGQAVSALGADTTGRQRSYAAVQDELARLDAQLQSERAGIDVNNPQSVARFRQLLGQRDAAFQRSTSLASGDLAGAVERYNARVNEYNARCADRPRDPVLLGRVQATLSCPPSY
ncbi:MAG TPA: hypothetical protein VIM52_09405 [Stellaceae bacterium]